MTKVLRRGDFDAARTKVGGKEPHHHGLIIQRRKVEGNLKPMRFVSLHHHSTFSYLDGYQLPEAHVRRATELNMSAITMTEHGNVDSHVKFEGAAVEQGIKPLFGCEVYMPTGPYWYADGTETQRKHHLTLLAADAEGYRNLLMLVTKSWRNFYHEPTVTWADLLDHRSGLWVLSGCQGSLLFCSTVGGKGIEREDASYRRGLGVARKFRQAFGDRYLIEVQAFPELKATRQFNRLAGKLARAVGTRIVATMDCHYTMLEEAEVQKILHNLRPGEKRTLEEQAREWGYNAPLCPPPNDNTIYRRLVASGLSRDEAIQAIVTTEEVAQASTVELPKLPMVRFPVPDGYADAQAYWRHLLREGWTARRMSARPPAERRRYQEQLAHEMELIEGKDFVDYFLLVQAGVRYVKEQGIPVGPARGSAAASIAAWLLRITEVDPLNPAFEDLLRFERFISVDRLDLPDIDLDFPSEARPILRDYYTSMMGGPEYVNNVGTFTQFKGKNSLDDVARVFGVPKGEVNSLKAYLIERSSGDLRASSTIEDTVDQFPQAREVWERNPDLAKGSWLEGNIKGFGVHAAAIVLSNQPITTVTTVAEREVPKGSGNIVQVVPLDKYDAERQGLVKMDFLGLNTMSIIWDIMKRLGWDNDRLYSLPLDDPKVYRRFQEVDVTGVFQFEGRATRYVCASLGPERFGEIMDCIALCRPGPLHNGAAREYAAVKQGATVPDVLHPALEHILGATQFQMVYQEQILTIARDIGGFDARGVGEIRKIISLKKGEQAFQRKREEFIAGAVRYHERNGGEPIDEDTADRILGSMVTSGAYAFNAAHCAAYGLISYYTQYFKVHEPDVFFAASLAEAAGDKERTRYLIRDADQHGVRILLPSVRRSEANWAPVRKAGKPISPVTIRAGFRQLEGVGEKSCRVVAEARDAASREGREWNTWGDLQTVRGIGAKTVEKVNAMMTAEDPFKAWALDRALATVKPLLAGWGLPEPTHTAEDLAAEELQGRAAKVTWIGTIVKRNIRDIFEQNRAKGKELDPATMKDPHLHEWALLTSEDDTDQLLVTVDRWKYPHFKEALFDFKMGHDLLLIEATKPARSGVRKLNVKRLWVIDPEGE